MLGCAVCCHLVIAGLSTLCYPYDLHIIKIGAESRETPVPCDLLLLIQFAFSPRLVNVSSGGAVFALNGMKKAMADKFKGPMTLEELDQTMAAFVR